MKKIGITLFNLHFPWFFLFSIFHFTFIMLMLLPVNKTFEIVLFLCRTHNVLETNVVCSLKRLTAGDKTFQILFRSIKNFCKILKSIQIYSYRWKFVPIIYATLLKAISYIQRQFYILSGEKDHLASSIKTFFGGGSDQESSQQVGWKLVRYSKKQLWAFCNLEHVRAECEPSNKTMVP